MVTYFTEHSVNAIAEQSGFQILGQEVLPGNDAKFLPIPSNLDNRVRNLIGQDYPDGLYGHQAEAIDASLKGDDICLSAGDGVEAGYLGYYVGLGRPPRWCCLWFAFGGYILRRPFSHLGQVFGHWWGY